ncbi:KilA-N domain-containing protein [Sedimentibacter hydroxybenzoicus DSM 7310]|uniref:KilA-N domain-containing protein n=1 Tax=Sedimentibacter hydroxybenzoicus DSM 7310 TaxID=1123245 RepID=A0A974BIY1_SEDHY|nr:KilA-N domain-containing protein [Sedimentibacter hydroxybenzoicus]NYB73622.1 KilA-N domain-containing protein [Sedimentibacter hydroxybenzoicus DSM 7310]
MAKIYVNNAEISVIEIEEKDYTSLTDMVKNIDNGLVLIEKWLRNKNTIEFLGIWEGMYNLDFDEDEYNEIMNEAGFNRFTLSVKQWTKRTNSRGIIAKAGRYGGTYAHKDIAFEFAKINYRIHTEAIKQNLIPKELTKQQISYVYANEADVLNVAMFGKTANEWRCGNPDKKGNIRDYASINELICLSNMENINAVLINDGISQTERLIKLNKIAIQQMTILEEQKSPKLLK